MQFKHLEVVAEGLRNTTFFMQNRFVFSKNVGFANFAPGFMKLFSQK